MVDPPARYRMSNRIVDGLRAVVPADCRWKPAIRAVPQNGIRAAVLAAAILVSPDSISETPAIAGTPAPQRIVSMGLCTDQLVLLLARRDRIASLSYLAADPDMSVMAKHVGDIPLNHGLAEEILPLRPDLVFTGAYAGGPTAALLERLGHRVVRLDYARNLDDVRTLIRRVAALVGEPKKGEAEVAAFDARLARIPPPRPDGPRPVAAVYQPNGYTTGSDTLAGAVIRAAGFQNLGDRLGLTGTVALPLERLLQSRPDILIRRLTGYATSAQATDLLRHPALKAAFPGDKFVTIPHRYWICGGPEVAEAVARLATARSALSNSRSALSNSRSALLESRSALPEQAR